MVIICAVRKPTPNCVPTVLRIVPISREAKSPWAMAPKASIPYRLAEIMIFFRLRKD